MFRNIPTVTRNLLLINILVFLAGLILEPRFDLEYWGGLNYFLAHDFHLYQFVTYMFLHGSFTHLFFNMFALWMFGCVIERTWGSKRFLIYYIVSGVGAGLCQEIVQFISYGNIPINSITIGASGAVYAILLAFGMTFPEEKIFIFPLPVPIKAKWFVCIYAAIELFSATSSSGDGVAHMAHLGGMLFGFLLIMYWKRQANFNKPHRTYWSHKTHGTHQINNTPSRTATREDDMAYNARKKELQDEIDALLDKIRKSGYDSLTKAEKQRLFEASREK